MTQFDFNMYLILLLLLLLLHFILTFSIFIYSACANKRAHYRENKTNPAREYNEEIHENEVNTLVYNCIKINAQVPLVLTVSQKK